MRAKLSVTWLAAVVAVGLTATLSVGIATAAESSSGVKACATKGGVLVLATKKDKCPKGDVKKTFGARGATGVRGPRGLQGEPGKIGNTGPGAVALSYTSDVTDSVGKSTSIDGWTFTSTCQYTATTSASTTLDVTAPTGVTVDVAGIYSNFGGGMVDPDDIYNEASPVNLFTVSNGLAYVSATMTGSNGQVFGVEFYSQGDDRTSANLTPGESNCEVSGTVTPTS